ncbi:cell division protein FtsZ [Opitutus terrae]|uniref:Cell division protein FtsZ n=1 Tax=Opitutus terrae (strain DSM 11246 / JCM 15787 / PB90-1) TaxID=452637 RepID=B1ZUV2_OPITP|nr:cell division protein FtsZ [Opitutus terrae]ACB75922.1 cell division protein FtsZ [Opitutus terrae PB90-1]
MNLNELPLEHALLTDRAIAIKMVGVGGAGSNAVDRLKMENLERLQLGVINTDYQALASSPVQDKVLIGMSITRGLGAGGDPELGREAAEADREKITNVVKDCDLVFLIGGMGGGTGSGALPVVAEIASEQGALVIAFVTMPFSFEGGRRLKQAEEGLSALRRVCDAVIPLPNDVLLQESAENETVLDSFARADEWIGRGVKSIWAMLFKTGLINLDFAGLQQVFAQRGGKTLFGLGEGTGPNAVADAVGSLKLCPLLHTPEFSRKADRLLVNIIGGTDLTLPKVNELMTAITEQFGRESHIIMGAVIDEEMQNRVDVCVIGTTDMGNRGVPARRHTSMPGRGRLTNRPEPTTTVTSDGAATTPVVGTGAEKPAQTTLEKEAAAAAAKLAQHEFGFGELESRGHFEKTDRNLFDGQDLDVPTYLRKGIKVSI